MQVPFLMIMETPWETLNNSWDWARAQLSNLANSAQNDHPGISRNEIISKGGVFDYQGERNTLESKLTHQYGNIIRTFLDPIAQTRDSVTGDYYSGTPQYKPIAHSNGDTGKRSRISI